MSKADRLREEPTWLKLFFAAFLAIDVSIIAWLVQSYDTAETVYCLVRSSLFSLLQPVSSLSFA